jgi:hypothetical protein
MNKTATDYDLKELERVEAQVMKIQKACDELKAFSAENGKIPFIEKNVERIQAPLHLLMGISEVLELLREQRESSDAV